MNGKTQEQQERASAAEWYECVRHEAEGALAILHGIEQPTERQVAAYILYGEKSLNRRMV